MRCWRSRLPGHAGTRDEMMADGRGEEIGALGKTARELQHSLLSPPSK